MAEETQQAVTSEQRPADPVALRHVLIGYGHDLKEMPRSTLETYKKMERDYAVGMCLGVLSFPIISSEWSIEVKEVGVGSQKPEVRNQKSEVSSQDGTGTVFNQQSAISNQQSQTVEAIQEDLTRMMTPIMRNVLKHQITALSRKAAPFEKCFEMRDGKLSIKSLDPVQIDDAKLLVIEEPIEGQTKRSFGGMSVKVEGAKLSHAQQADLYGQPIGIEGLPENRVPVPAWKTFWFAMDANDGQLVGESARMERAKRPWWSKASKGGLYDIEDIWFRQRVATARTVYYRAGTQPDGRRNEDIAAAIGKSLQANSVALIPLGIGQTPDTADFVVKDPEGQKKSDEVPKQIDSALDPRIFFAFGIPPLVGGVAREVGAMALGDVLLKLLIANIEDIGHQCTQAISEYVLQPLCEWNYGDRWTVKLSLKRMAPQVEAMLHEIIKSLFTGQQAGQMIQLTDLSALYEETGLPLAEDAADRIEQIKSDLAGGGAGLADKLAGVAGSESSTALAGGSQTRPQAPGNGSKVPPALLARLQDVTAERDIEGLTQEAGVAAGSFWESLQLDLKKKRLKQDSMRS